MVPTPEEIAVQGGARGTGMHSLMWQGEPCSEGAPPGAMGLKEGPSRRYLALLWAQTEEEHGCAAHYPGFQVVGM